MGQLYCEGKIEVDFGIFLQHVWISQNINEFKNLSKIEEEVNKRYERESWQYYKTDNINKDTWWFLTLL